MARLPVPGSDDGNWGDILNDYLRQIHTEGGLLKDSVVAETNLSVGVQNKLNALSSVTDGKEVELRNSSGFIQWRYLGGSEASWTNSVALGDLTGPTGAVGPAGPKGEAGDGESSGFDWAISRLLISPQQILMPILELHTKTETVHCEYAEHPTIHLT